MVALGSEYAPALLLNVRELLNRSSLNLPMAPFQFVAGRSANLGIRKALSRITNFIYKHCACFARCRRRQEATELQKHRVRQRQPRLLFTEVGGVRLWSDLEAEILRQCDNSFTMGVQEVLVLQETPNSRIVLVLCSDRLLVVQLRYPYLQSSVVTESPWQGGDPSEDLESRGEFDQWLDEDLGPSSNMRNNKKTLSVTRSTNTIRSSLASLARWDSEASSIMQPQQSDHIVQGKTIQFCDLQEVEVHVPQTGISVEPALLLAHCNGVQKLLPFSSAILGEGVDVKEVLNHLAEAVRSAMVHPGRKAHWDLLHKTLHPDEEARWHQDDGNRSYDWEGRNPAGCQDSIISDDFTARVWSWNQR